MNANAAANPMVKAEAVSKSFGSNTVLRSISLEVQRGEVLCMVGPSGSGKSTFLRCINHLETVNAGRLFVDGELVGYRQKDDKLYEIHPREAAKQRRDIGMVFQRFNLFPHMTTLQNVMAAPTMLKKGRKSALQTRAMELLTRVGLADKHDHYPAHLSGGQQQRVAIARALALDPEVLLFDEPTSALDPELVGEVLSVIRALAQGGRTLIIVTHEIGFAADVADHVIFLDHGRIVEQGAPEQVLRAPAQQRTQEFLDWVI